MIFKWTMQKYKCDHLKEIVSTLVGNKINVGHSQKNI